MTAESRIERLGHVALWVRDLERSEAFYCDILGLKKVTVYKARILFLRASESIESHDLALIRIFSGGNEVKECKSCINHCAWKVSTFADLQYFYDSLRVLGLKLQVLDHGIALGIYFSDPDGHRIEIYHELPILDLMLDQDDGKGSLQYPNKLKTHDGESPTRWY